MGNTIIIERILKTIPATTTIKSLPKEGNEIRIRMHVR